MAQQNTGKNIGVTLAEDDRIKIKRITDAMFPTQQVLGQIPNFVGAVTYDGEVVAVTEHNATANSLFRIASMSKSFTAAAVLALRDRGSLQLDTAIAEYAPEYSALAGPTADSPPITCRHLLTMSSGLATDDPWGDRHLDISDDELDAVVGNGPIFAGIPGTDFEYSNLGYGILGRIIHRVAGIRPQQFIREQLLVPLGMTNTVWESNHAEACDVVNGLRTDDFTPEEILSDGGLATMGGLWSTISDLAKWSAFFTNAFLQADEDADDPSILKRSSRREMQRVHTIVPGNPLTSRDGAKFYVRGGYGMGLFITQNETLGEDAGHSGGLPGYGSNMRWVKGTPFGIIALANVSYASMSSCTQRTLDALTAANVIRRPVVAPSTAMVSAGEALHRLLTVWSDDAADQLFSDNVALDMPYKGQRDVAEKLLVKHGSLRVARIEADHRAAGTLVLHSDSTEIKVEFSMAPVAGHRIQHYALPSE